MNKAMMLFIVVVVAIAAIIRVTKSFSPLPIGVRHFYHRIAAPADLYNPIVVDEFLFNRKGFMRTYTLEAKYLDIYDIGILFLKNGFSSKYKFSGRLLVEFLFGNEIIHTEVAESIDTAWYVENDMTKYKKVSLMNFGIPLLGRYKDDIHIRISVLEPDQELVFDYVRIYIAVSSTP